MIYLSFNIRNPLYFHEWKDENCINLEYPVTKNKTLEIQFEKNTNDIIRFMFQLSFKQSHAGIKFAVDFMTFSIMFDFFDNRHWDYHNNCWEINPEKE